MSSEALVTLILAGVGGIVWMIRLEGRINSIEQKSVELDKKIDKLEVKHEALDNKIVEKLSVIERSLAKIEGRLSIENEDK